MSDEYDADKEELKRDDYSVIDDAHSTLGDSSNKIHMNAKKMANKNKEDDKDIIHNKKKKN